MFPPRPFPLCVTPRHSAVNPAVVMMLERGSRVESLLRRLVQSIVVVFW